jgi:tripartite-type tricarboxylate transporter receptor subunit TctC
MLKLALATAIGITAALATPAAAQKFPEKNIDFIIPFGPGGGFDRTVRIIAGPMEAALPNKVSVLPKNVPGAGGAKGVATVFRAAPDGYTLAIANMPGAAIPAIIGEPTEYEIDKFTWIARVGVEEYMLAVPSKSAIRSIEDIQKLGRPLKVLSTDYGSTAYAAGQIVGEVLKFPVQPLTGYKGTNDYIVGAIRGDGEAVVAPVSTLKQFVEAGDMRPIFSTEEKSSIKDVKTIAELGFPQLTGLAVERFVIGPPGMPAETVKILSDSIMKAVASPEAQKHAATEGFAPLPAAEAKASADNTLALYSKYKEALGKK